MILVFFGICLILFIIAIVYDKMHDDDGFYILMSSVPVLICLITAIVLTVSVVKLSVIDQKIEMYEQENIKIEQQVETAVKAYQEHEKDVLTSVKPDSYMQLVTLYPELKSDMLVQTQIETYQENNKKIKELKEQAINGNVKRWWLYFGHQELSLE